MELETFLEELQKSCKIAKLPMEKAIKKQFNKKRQNSQRLKQEDNMWLEVKKYPVETTLKKVGPKMP